MITPDSPDRAYSTRLRTALVLDRLRHQRRVPRRRAARAPRSRRQDRSRSPAAASACVGALFAAVDGGARLWDADGIWKGPARAASIAWRRPLRVAGWALAAAAAVLAVPIVLLALAVLAGHRRPAADAGRASAARPPPSRAATRAGSRSSSLRRRCRRHSAARAVRAAGRGWRRCCASAIRVARSRVRRRRSGRGLARPDARRAAVGGGARRIGAPPSCGS